MKIKFEKTQRGERDMVKIEADGTVLTHFAGTGHLKSVTRTRFAAGASASTGSFSYAKAGSQDEEIVGHAPYAVMFVSELDGIEKISMIERFTTEEAAKQAHARIARTIVCRSRKTRLKSIWKSLLLLVALPLFCLIVGMAGVRFLDSHNGAIDMLRDMMRTPAGASAFQQSAMEIPAIPALNAHVSTRALPAGGGAPVTINFGLTNQPPNKVLYVYSDPNCPACRQFDSHLKDLEKDFEIHILPVAYQKDSLAVARSVVCSGDQSEQKRAWSGVMAGAVIQNETCDAGGLGIAANMREFDSLHFTQTPQVVSGTGYVFPVGATAGDIRQQAAKLTSQ